MWNKFKRWRWAIAAAVGLVLFLGYSFYPEAMRVDIGEVSSGPMAVGVTDDGVTRVEDVYVVSAPITGQVTRIEIEPGDTVERGKTILARMAAGTAQPLDPRTRAELQGALSAARASERSAISALTLAEQTLSRSEELAKRGFLSQAGLDTARSDAATRRAAVDQARAEAGRISASLSQPVPADARRGSVAIRAPHSGRVLRVLTESEGNVLAGTPLVELGDPARIEVVVDLLSREAVQVTPGARVEITNWGGDPPLIGRVQRIEPFGELKISALGIEEQRVNVIIEFDEDADRLARLGHGFQLDATIILWQSDKVTRVPIGALFRGDNGEWRVFEVQKARAVEKAITLRHINDTWAEVLDGIAPGARVVVNPGASIADGTRISERRN